jgi:catechol 2,3-dioxygenase-like lactoylglutathione lyase family enzyme
MNKYVDSTEQLVTEIVVRDIKRSVHFYRHLGFELLRDDGDFVELSWEDHRLFLVQLSTNCETEYSKLSASPHFPVANVRVMVPQVDKHWKMVNEIGAEIVVPIADRHYGLRDFTIVDPDGFGIRFASMLHHAIA